MVNSTECFSQLYKSGFCSGAGDAGRSRARQTTTPKKVNTVSSFAVVGTKKHEVVNVGLDLE